MGLDLFSGHVGPLFRSSLKPGPAH